MISPIAAGCHADDAFEYACEVIGRGKAELVGDFLNADGCDEHLSAHFNPECVPVLDRREAGFLTEQLKKAGDPKGAQLQTGENFHDRPSGNPDWVIAPFSKPKFMHRYGYYECRCRLPMQKGWWAAFWLQSPIIGCSPDPAIAGVEVDIMETFCDYGKISRETVSNNCHWSGYGADYKTSRLVKVPLMPTDDDFHTFAVEWNRDGYIFYTDGVETNRMNQAVSHTDQFILLTTECEGYRTKERKPSADLKKIVLPDEFIVDYVRVWDEVE